MSSKPARNILQRLTGSCQQPVNITHDYTSCCLYRAEPPHDEQQACSKHIEAYYWNKLIENSASCWFILYWYITMHGQQNIKLCVCACIFALIFRHANRVVLYCHLCPFWLYHIFFLHYLTKGTIFWEKLWNVNCLFSCSVKHLSERDISHFKKNSGTCYHKCKST